MNVRVRWCSIIPYTSITPAGGFARNVEYQPPLYVREGCKREVLRKVLRREFSRERVTRLEGSFST